MLAQSYDAMRVIRASVYGVPLLVIKLQTSKRLRPLYFSYAARVEELDPKWELTAHTGKCSNPVGIAQPGALARYYNDQVTLLLQHPIGFVLVHEGLGPRAYVRALKAGT